jgi:hypothetical protein
MNHNYLGPVRFNKQWKNQKGITGIGIAAILAVGAFFVLISMRLFPIYVEHFSVTTHLENLAADSATKRMTDKEMWKKLRTTFDIDDVDNVKEEHLFVDRDKGGGVTLAIEYEVRTKMLGNVEVVVVFADEAEVN